MCFPSASLTSASTIAVGVTVALFFVLLRISDVSLMGMFLPLGRIVLVVCAVTFNVIAIAIATISNLFMRLVILGLRSCTYAEVIMIIRNGKRGAENLFH